MLQHFDFFLKTMNTDYLLKKKQACSTSLLDGQEAPGQSVRVVPGPSFWEGGPSEGFWASRGWSFLLGVWPFLEF